MAAVRVAAWLNTSIFDEGFVSAWSDLSQRNLLITAFTEHSQNSYDENIFKAIIWNARINSVLATTVARFVGAKIPGNKEIGDIVNPWKSGNQYPQTKEDKKALKIVEEQRKMNILAEFFGIEKPVVN